MMRVESARQPIGPPAGSASRSSAKNWPSGVSPPPLADQALMAACTLAATLVTLCCG
ncbi:hypothetical protein [Ottowia sp.]|uniref:hypothetical protein n=1 Tax=Ottowia sp. TaxID=1898956 RepID=UPI0025D13BD1|nr:hypothetical protein [Ottowia sp.]MBK6615271.1 hypothetical protein [Ottowia sp.]